MKLFPFAGLALASVSLCACAGLPLTGNPAADAKTAVANVQAVNATLAPINQKLLNDILQKCGVDVDFDVMIPNPIPAGKLAFKCHIDPGGLLTPAAAPSQAMGGAALAPAAPEAAPGK